MNFYEKLKHAAQLNRSLVCVGLDPDLKKLPACLAGKKNPIFEFNKAIIDATRDWVCCYKPQIAYYAGQGAEAELRMTIDYIREQVTFCRSEAVDSSTGAMDMLNSLPRFISKSAVRLLCWLDRHGWVPPSMIATDPYYTSCVISNLGSIGLKSGYHHLTNWGTCSIFCIIGEKKRAPFFQDDGTAEMRETVELGLTIDERLADGYYYSKSVRLLKKLLECPELLERPMTEEVDY